MNYAIMRIGLFCLSVILSSTVITGLSSCAVKDRVTDVNDTFLKDVDISAKRPNLPFDHSWVNPNFKKSDFDAVYFKPIRTSYLKGQWAASTSVAVTSEEDFMSKATEIAAYFRSELIKRSNAIRRKKLAVANQPAPGTLVVDIALTELELSHPIARAGALVAPVPGTGPALSAMTDPHVAFAARVTDAATGQLVATVADRKFAPTRVIDLNKLTVSSSSREIVSLWADEIAAAIQGDRVREVNEKRFDWMPW